MWETLACRLIATVPWLLRSFGIVSFDSVALFLHPSKSKRIQGCIADAYAIQILLNFVYFLTYFILQLFLYLFLFFFIALSLFINANIYGLFIQLSLCN